MLTSRILGGIITKAGYDVKLSEVHGMAQRGGNVVSHVRMGDAGEEVFAPLLAEGTADLVIAFEPAEAARVLPFLAPDGLLVTATTAIQPVTAALSDKPYRADNVLANIERSLAGTGARFVAVDDVALTDAVGSRKVLNSVLLASALKEGRIALDLDDLRRALEECVKPRFVALNLAAVDAVAAR